MARTSGASSLPARSALPIPGAPRVRQRRPRYMSRELNHSIIQSFSASAQVRRAFYLFNQITEKSVKLGPYYSILNIINYLFSIHRKKFCVVLHLRKTCKHCIFNTINIAQNARKIKHFAPKMT